MGLPLLVLLLLASLSSTLRLYVNVNVSTITDHVSPTMYGSGMETYNHGKRYSSITDDLASVRR